MVNSCSAYGCSNRSAKGGPQSFHRFPKNQELRRKWIVAAKREKFEPSEYSCICSDNFLPSDYNFCPSSDKNFSAANCKPVLKPDAVPTVFVLWINQSLSEESHL